MHFLHEDFLSETENTFAIHSSCLSCDSPERERTFVKNTVTVRGRELFEFDETISDTSEHPTEMPRARTRALFVRGTSES